MRVEINEDLLRDKDHDTGHVYVLAKGDTITVSENTGRRWCAYGWARDVDGVHPSGERIVGTREALHVCPERNELRTVVHDHPLVQGPDGLLRVDDSAGPKSKNGQPLDVHTKRVQGV
jgi:hypothetical protein